MKKIIILGGALCLFAGAEAHAGISVNLGLGIPQPTYYEAPVAPVYVAPSYVQYDYGDYRYRGGRRGPDRGHEARRPHR